MESKPFQPMCYIGTRKKMHFKHKFWRGVYLCTLSFCCCWDRGWGALTHFYFLTSLKRRFFCFMITSVPFSMIISVIKWSSVKIYVWSAFFHFRQYSYHVTRFEYKLNGLAVHSKEQAKQVPKIFQTNEIARNKICSVDLLVEENWMCRRE
jgi:hypothetical protein